MPFDIIILFLKILELLLLCVRNVEVKVLNEGEKKKKNTC